MMEDHRTEAAAPVYEPSITSEQIRAQLTGQGLGAVCAHAEPLLDAMINRAQIDTAYSSQFHAWLRGDNGCGTVHLRDNLCEPLRPLPHIQAIGEQFNPTTEWHNTWMPLDTAAHRARYGLDPNVW